VQLHAASERALGPAFAVEADVTGGDALDVTALVVQHLGGGDAGVDLDAVLVLGLRAEPAAHVAERHDVVAMIVELRNLMHQRAVVTNKAMELVPLSSIVTMM